METQLSGDEVMSSSLSLGGRSFSQPFGHREASWGYDGRVALSAEALEWEGGVPHETFITVPAGLRSCLPTTAILRS